MTSASQLAMSPPDLEFRHRLLAHKFKSKNAPYMKWLQSDNLRLFRETFNKFMDIFEEVVNLQAHDGAVEIFNNFVKLRANEWRAMEAALRPDSSEAESRFLRNRESQVVITVLQSMVSGIDSFITAAQCKIDAHINEVDITCRREIERLHEEIYQLRRDLSDVRWWQTEDKAALQQAQHEVVLLKSLLKDKDQRIHSLEKDSNVKHWEEEKRKIIAKYQTKIDELESKVRKRKTSKSSKRGQLQLPDANENTIGNEVEDIFEKNTRLMEKDIRHHARSIKLLQSHCTSIIHGFKSDFQKFSDRLLDENPTLSERHRSVIRNLEERLRTMLQFTSSHPLEDLSAFPAHYRQRVEYEPLSLVRESQPTRKLSNTPSPRHSICLPLGPEGGFSHETDSNSLFEETELSSVYNPEFLLSESKEINFHAVMRYFPQMTKEYIEEQWEQFAKFDKNKDHTLDLDEMMGAMYSTTGHMFNPREIKEAMLEADLDGSNTIDFFEYLNVANMLMKKSGQSAFKSNILTKQRKNISKACVIQ